jgi:hypothetical protein
VARTVPSCCIFSGTCRRITAPAFAPAGTWHLPAIYRRTHACAPVKRKRMRAHPPTPPIRKRGRAERRGREGESAHKDLCGQLWAKWSKKGGRVRYGGVRRTSDAASCISAGPGWQPEDDTRRRQRRDLLTRLSAFRYSD